MELENYFEKLKERGHGSFLVLGDISAERLKQEIINNFFVDKNAALFDLITPETEKVEDLRKALIRMNTKSSFGLKVFFLPNFSQFSKILQNTMLKSLEEVKRGEIFILQSQTYQGILPTILSRVEKTEFNFNPAVVNEGTFDFNETKKDFSTWYLQKPKNLADLRLLLKFWQNSKFKNLKQEETFIKYYLRAKKINVNLDLFWINLYNDLN